MQVFLQVLPLPGKCAPGNSAGNRRRVTFLILN